MSHWSKDVTDLIKFMLEFPHPKICRHYVAGSLLQILEKHGTPVSKELAKAIVDGNDETAISELIRELNQ